MEERVMEQLKAEKERNEELFEKVMLLYSLRGRLDAIAKHHNNSDIFSFAMSLLDDLDEQLNLIERKYH